MYPSQSKWIPVLLLWCVCFLNYSDRQAVFVLFPLLKSSLHLSDLQLGVAGSSFMWAYACFGPVAGWLGDRWPLRLLILTGLLIWISLAVLTGMARNDAELVILRSLSGLAEAFYFPAAMTLISRYHGSATRSRAMAIHQSAVYVGSIGGGTLAGFVGQHLGWRFAFWIFAAIGVAVAVLVGLFLGEPASELETCPHQPSFLGGASPSLLRSAILFFSNPVVRSLCVAFIGANFVAMVFASWLPTYLHDKFHMTVSLAGLNATLFLQIASIAGVLTGGIAADRVAKRAGGRVFVQATGLLGGVLFLFFAGRTLAVPVLLAMMVGFGFCKGIYDSNIFASLYDSVTPRVRASSAGLLNSLGWLGGGFAPVAIAYAARRFSLSACLSATALIYLLMAGFLFSNAYSMKLLKRSGA